MDFLSFFLSIQFQEERFKLKTGASSGRRKVCGLIFSAGFCRTVVDYVQIQNNKLANQVQSSTVIHIYFTVFKQQRNHKLECSP